MTNERELLKPKRLRPGDTIGVISPASPSERPSDVPRSKSYLEEMGFHVVVGRNVNRRKGIVAASEKERADDLNEMFSRPDIDAVFVTQGGYGSAQIIDKIDFDNIRTHPKIFTGFSDITSLHLAINKFARIVTFHSCGMTRFSREIMTEYTKTQFLKAVMVPQPLGDIELADPRKWLYPISPGIAEGELIGGNLSLLCAGMGTPYQPDLDGKILFLEEVDTEPWIVDNSMSHLRNCGVLNRLRGVVVGEFKNCVPNEYKPGYLSDLHVEEVLEYYLQPLGIPVLYGLPLGHTDNMAALPLGVRVRLDCDQKRLTVLESGVI